MSEWFRFWQVEPLSVARSAGMVLLGSLNGQDTHLRTYISWYVESTTLQAATEPIFAGVVATYGDAADPPADPIDPGATNYPLTGDWWQTGIYFPASIGSRSTGRIVWPAQGPERWDIKTNRRMASDQRMNYYFRWAGPTDLAASLRSVVTWSSLVEIRPTT